MKKKIAYGTAMRTLSVGGLDTYGDVPLLQRSQLGKVWSGHPVSFCLQTYGNTQYVGYYDEERQFTVASRQLDKPQQWVKKVLPSKVGWDTHNYITMTLDDDGHLHVSGNLHCNPLLYFRTTVAGDVTTLEKIDAMTGVREDSATYPCFFRGPNQELIFTYRDGRSGNGDQIYNVYDHKTKTWSRLLDTPLTDGQDLMNAYLVGPQPGPDGFFHLCWVWRDNPSCDTNHDLSYARSKNLIDWETIDGTPVQLPMSLNTPGIIVDPTPVKGGLINMGIRMSFDAENRVIISYHKYDENGNSQIYNTRYENGAWVVHKATDWKWKWEFTGGGSVPCSAAAGDVELAEDGTMAQFFYNADVGGEYFQLDPVTLAATTRLPAPPPVLPAECKQLDGTFPGLGVRITGDGGTGGPVPNQRFFLRWETLAPNRDRPRPEPWPEPSILEVITVGEQ